MKSRLSKPTYIILLAGLALLIVLVYRHFAPFGKEVKYSFVKTIPGSEEISTISTTQDKQPLKLTGQLIKNKVTRFSLKADQKTIDSINVHFQFKPGQKEIKLGVRGDEKQTFFYQPLYYSVLEDINWNKLTDGDLTLFQKEQKFTSVSEFLKTPPLDQKIAIYNINQNIINQASVDSRQGKFSLPVSIRGNHSFLISVGNSAQPLSIKVGKKDINMYDGADKLNARLYWGDKLVFEKSIEDDGVTDKSKTQSTYKETEIKINNPQLGIYRLDLDVDSSGSDLEITKLDINERLVMVSKTFFPVGDKGFTFYSSNNKVSVQTAHQMSLQTLKINNQTDFVIDKVNQKKIIDLPKIAKDVKYIKIDSPKSDITLSSEGYFAFSSDSFFNYQTAKIVNLRDFADFSDISSDVNYVLTSVPAVAKKRDWLDISTTIDPQNIKLTNGSLYFSLEIPELDKNGGSLEIAALDVVVKEKTASPTPTFIPTITPTITVSPSASPTAIVTVTPMATSTPAPSQVVQRRGLFDFLKRWFASKPVVPTKAPATPTLVPTITPSGNCSINDKMLSVGSTFAAADGCNFCTCAGNLQIECTSNTCSQK